MILDSTLNSTEYLVVTSDYVRRCNTKGSRNNPEAFCIGSGEPPGLLADDLRDMSRFRGIT